MDYANFDGLNIEVEDAIATVTIDREQANNSIDPATHREFERLWADIAEDQSIRAIMLTGRGEKAFSAGGDIKKMRERIGTEAGLQYNLALPRRINLLLERMLAVPQPIVAAVNGDAIGLGLTLALFCDLTVVAEDAWLGDTHVKAGLVAGDGGTVILPLLVGLAKSRDYLLRARLFQGAEAVSAGLMNQAVPRAEVREVATGIARELASLPRHALQWTKLAANKPIRERMNLLADGAAAHEVLSMFADDHREALDAMIERRKPQFNRN